MSNRTYRIEAKARALVRHRKRAEFKTQTEAIPYDMDLGEARLSHAVVRLVATHENKQMVF